MTSPKATATSPSGYAELHAHSYFSFLDGVSSPAQMVAEAARLKLDALAVLDHDGFYGLVQTAQAARDVGMPTVIGAELTIGLTRRQNGIPDPEGRHLVVLARDPRGYAQLSRTIATANLAGSKGQPVLTLQDLAANHDDHWAILTGCRKGVMPSAFTTGGTSAAEAALTELIDHFGSHNIYVELWHHHNPTDDERNDTFAELADRYALPTVATTNAHYATPAGHQLAEVVASVRARSSLREMNGWLPSNPTAHLRSAAQQRRRFAPYPGAVERAGVLGRELAFDLSLIAPRLPAFPVPDAETEATYLRTLTSAGATIRYGPRNNERVAGAWRQLDYELEIISALDFPGYFLVVWDIVQFCDRNNIYCQGRGSAANSAVCYALGITNADPVSLGLLFERFLSPARDGPPDIDLDIESGRREEVIQYVYSNYGREHAAQVANVITYRPRSAIRDAAKAFGYSEQQGNRWTKRMHYYHRHSPVPADVFTPNPTAKSSSTTSEASQATGSETSQAARPDQIPMEVQRVAMELLEFPRHLGVHSGGMVICDRPIIEVCPVEWATAPGRTVLQWDKDDCAAMGLVKFDLLGLGMLEALHRTVDLVAQYHGAHIDLALLPQEDEVYDRLCKADTVGVFQVESRAQMGTLPRLKPRNFYDLVVEVALIRPGPIQGGSVHPYLRRRNGKEAITYLHPLLEPSLKKTLGVPIFQEQLMQMAIDVAGFPPADADRLRQAMGSKRSAARMEAIRARLYEGMAERGVIGAVADQIYDSLRAFASFGFPESHAASFAYLVYSSAWLKLHYPAAFLAGLLNSQPMGFWSPATLVADARRHGVTVLRPDINHSQAGATLEPQPLAAPTSRPQGSAGPTHRPQPPAAQTSLREPAPGRPAPGQPGPREPAPDRPSSTHLAAPATPAVRLGLESVSSISTDVAHKIAATAPHRSLGELVQRTGLNRRQLEALATAGATASLDDGDRRATLWSAGVAATSRADQFDELDIVVDAPPLPQLSRDELLIADLSTTGISVDSSPFELLAAALAGRACVSAAELRSGRGGQRVQVAGIVTHRQRPETASGITFLNLEDDTGLINVVCSIGLWRRHAQFADTAVALLVRGVTESSDGVINVIAHKLEELPLSGGEVPIPTRNYC